MEWETNNKLNPHKVPLPESHQQVSIGIGMGRGGRGGGAGSYVPKILISKAAISRIK